jgi:hypothetical protein
MEMKEALLDIVEQPTKYRVIVETQLPSLDPIAGNLYYMIDKGDCGVNGQGAKVYDHYQVTNSDGGGKHFTAWREVVEFFDKLAAATELDIYVETF